MTSTRFGWMILHTSSAGMLCLSGGYPGCIFQFDLSFKRAC
jgi:hypothetical protein